MRYDLKIPRSRIGVLIGRGGKTRKKIEEIGQVKLSIDSETGAVSIVGEDGELVYRTAQVVRAIGRGFSPEKAFLLFSGDYYLDIIDIGAIAGERGIKRQKARVIGTEGRARTKIEGMTSTKISVYGKTVSIIGLPEDVEVAHRAVIMLLQGAPHAAVYSFLDKMRKLRMYEVLRSGHL